MAIENVKNMGNGIVNVKKIGRDRTFENLKPTCLTQMER